MELTAKQIEFVFCVVASVIMIAASYWPKFSVQKRSRLRTFSAFIWIPFLITNTSALTCKAQDWEAAARTVAEKKLHSNISIDRFQGYMLLELVHRHPKLGMELMSTRPTKQMRELQMRGFPALDDDDVLMYSAILDKLMAGLGPSACRKRWEGTLGEEEIHSALDSLNDEELKTLARIETTAASLGLQGAVSKAAGEDEYDALFDSYFEVLGGLLDANLLERFERSIHAPDAASDADMCFVVDAFSNGLQHMTAKERAVIIRGPVE